LRGKKTLRIFAALSESKIEGTHKVPSTIFKGFLKDTYMTQHELQQLVDTTLQGLDAFAVEVSLSAANDIKVHADLNAGHITLAQIKTISRAIESALGEASENYAIEVSSPGMFTPFKVDAQYRKNLGREVVVKLLDGQKDKGKLAAFDGTSITLERTERVPKTVGKGKMDQTTQTQIPLAELSSITLDFKF
jgi:ribosome maturation factor RimP